MLQVDKIEPLTKAKYQVTLSDGTVWQLYTGDLRRYHLTEGAEISERLQEEIQHTCVTVRARKRVLALLEKMDRSEQELRMKLKQTGYTAEVIDDAIAYAGKYGYINDERYAANYIKMKSGSKSRRQIEMALKQKGISHLPERSEEDMDAEAEAIRKLISRKTADVDELEPEAKQKLAASLYRKGFPSELIRRELHL